MELARVLFWCMGVLTFLALSRKQFGGYKNLSGLLVTSFIWPVTWTFIGWCYVRKYALRDTSEPTPLEVQITLMAVLVLWVGIGLLWLP